MRKQLGVAAALIAMVSATSVGADTITINVPINVQNLMPQLTGVAVHCWLLNASKAAAPGWSPPGNWSNFAPLDASGGYQGTLTITFTANSGATKPASYYCSLSPAYSNGTPYAVDLTSGTIADDIGRPRPGSAYTPVVSGPIP